MFRYHIPLITCTTCITNEEISDDEIILISAFILQLAECWVCNTKQLFKQGFTSQFRLYVENTDLANQIGQGSSPSDGQPQAVFSSAQERFIPRLCSRSTFPPGLDDMKNAQQLGELALAYFDGGKDGTCSREMIPKTCPLVTANWEALEGLP